METLFPLLNFLSSPVVSEYLRHQGKTVNVERVIEIWAGHITANMRTVAEGLIIPTNR